MLALIFLLLTVALTYGVERSDFLWLILLYGGLFLTYLAAYWRADTPQKIRFWVIYSVALRLLLCFVMPNLSDDVFRFIWDGRLWHAGINPFDALPTDYAAAGFPQGLDAALFARLNSPNYFTIYPPVAQLTFYLGTFAESWWASAVVMKTFLFIAEVGTLWLLLRLLHPTAKRSEPLRFFENKKILLYALNPLLIVELMGNLHFEGVMIFFLLLAYFLLQRGQWQWSAVAFALSVASKLLPLMFLPFLIRHLGWRRSVGYFALVGALSAALFYPLLGDFFIQNFGKSLNLYFQKFEFNASLYYVLRWLGFQIWGYNQIQIFGPALALLSAAAIFGLALRRALSVGELPKYWLFAITIYLCCMTTVHPWYLALPLMLCLFTDFRYPIFWSAVVALTYINYSYTPYVENLWVVAVEYISVVLFFLIFDLKLRFRGRFAASRSRKSV